MERFKYILIGILIIAVGSCSSRDFEDNEVLREYYEPPVITVLAPNLNATYNNYVDVIVDINDTGGIADYTISTLNATTNVFSRTLTDLPKSIVITNRFYFQFGGGKNLTFEATDNLGNKSTRTVSINMQVVIPSLWITTYWYYEYSTTYTNVATVRYSGWVYLTNNLDSYPVNYDRTEVIRDDGTVFPVTVTNTYNGTNFWYCDVMLRSNQYNYLAFRAYTDFGSYCERAGSVYYDTIPPTVTVTRPANGGAYPWSFYANIVANDETGYIQKLVCYMDLQGTVTNYGSYYSPYVSFGADYNNLLAYAYAIDYAGNRSTIVSNRFDTDGSIPVVDMYLNGYYTNRTALDINGYASVNAGYIATIQMRANTGSYSTVFTGTVGDMSKSFTGSFTGLTPNAENTIYFKVTSSTGRVTEITNHLTVDTTAPKFDSITPSAGVYNVYNTYYCPYSFTISDNLSGLDYLVWIRRSPDVSETTNYDYFGGSQASRSGEIGYYSYGALITNIVILRDYAGNKTTNKIVTLFLPAVSASIATGDDNFTGTYAHPFRTINNAIAKAVAYGVTDVYVQPGTYSPGSGLAASGYGVTINASGIRLNGSFETGDGSQIYTHPSILDGVDSLSSIIYAANCNSVEVNYFIIRAGNSSANGSGILFNNVNDSKIYSSFIHNNNTTGSGGGVYISGNNNYIAGCVIATNKAANGGGVYVNGYGNIIQGNTTILSNRATTYGGGLYLSGNNNYLEYMTLNNNSAPYGGGMYLTGYRNNMYSMINIYNNYASTTGGGMYLMNSASNYIAGAFYRNSTAGFGGALALSGSKFDTFYGDGFYTNSAASGGSGIYASKATNLQINYCTFSNNTSSGGTGGTVMIAGSRVVSIHNSIFKNSYGYVNGGDIYASDTPNLSIMYNTFTNTSFSYGGDCNRIYLDQNLPNLVISQNYFRFTPNYANIAPIYENAAVAGHTLTYNYFYLNSCASYYHDTANGYISSIAYINTPSYTGASSAEGNIQYGY